MLETLRRMEVTDEAGINEDTGREIAIREGIGLFIVPGISKAGNEYSITAKIIDSKSGDILKSEVLYARTQDEQYKAWSLEALDRAKKALQSDPEYKEVLTEVEQRILHRLHTGEIIDGEEFQRRYPNGWKEQTEEKP